MTGRWSEVYVNGLGNAELVNGMYESNKLVFKPGKNTTRGEFVKMLVAAKGLDIGNNTEQNPISFLDSKDIASYAKNGVDYLTSIGVVNGYVDNTLKPKKPITREEVAKIIYDCIIRSDATILR